MNNLINASTAISVETFALMVASQKKDENARNAESKALDAMQAEGIKSTDFISPSKKESTATEEFYDDAKKSVVLSFTPSDQKLCTADRSDVASMTPKQKGRRKLLQQKIGSKIGQWKKSLARRENAGKNRTTASLESRVHSALSNVLKQIQKAETIDVDGTMATLTGFITQSIKMINLPKSEDQSK
jgi:hypothetical protein